MAFVLCLQRSIGHISNSAADGMNAADEELHMDDIWLTREQIDAMLDVQQQKNKNRKRRKVVDFEKSLVRKWQLPIVYKFAEKNLAHSKYCRTPQL